MVMFHAATFPCRSDGQKAFAFARLVYYVDVSFKWFLSGRDM